MTKQQLYEDFEGSWLKRANEYYVARKSAALFADYLFENGVRILGIDGSSLGQGLTRPILDVISDYSAKAPTRDEVLTFLDKEMDSVSHFNFVLDV